MHLLLFRSRVPIWLADEELTVEVLRRQNRQSLHKFVAEAHQGSRAGNSCTLYFSQFPRSNNPEVKGQVSRPASSGSIRVRLSSLPEKSKTENFWQSSKNEAGLHPVGKWLIPIRSSSESVECHDSAAFLCNCRQSLSQEKNMESKDIGQSIRTTHRPLDRAVSFSQIVSASAIPR